jgi:hypothetical protein
MDELHKKGVGKCRAGARWEHALRRFGRAVAYPQQPIGKFIRVTTSGAAVYDPFGDPPKILDQNDPKSDGDRPQFSDGKRLDLLVGAHIAAQNFRIEETVSMCNEPPSYSEHTWVSCERTTGELGQLAIVTGRQIPSHLADLFFHDVEVVNQPLSGWGDCCAYGYVIGDGAVGSQKYGFVIGEPARK